MIKNTENTGNWDLSAYLHQNPELTHSLLVKIVINAMPELVRGVILQLKTQKLTYSQISEKFGVNKGMIFKLEKLQFWPQKREKQEILIKKALELIKNGN